MRQQQRIDPATIRIGLLTVMLILLMLAGGTLAALVLFGS